MGKKKQSDDAGLRALARSLPKPKRDEVTVRGEETNEGMKRQTLYMPAQVHEQLRDLAHTERVSQQKLIREAVDMLFANRGLKSWDELTSM